MPVSYSSRQPFAGQGAVAVWFTLWMVALVQLLVILAVLAGQPTQWHWLSGRDVGGCGLMLSSLAICVALWWAPGFRLPSRDRRWAITLVIPLLTWLGLWGQQSITAQATWAVLLLGLGILLWGRLPHRELAWRPWRPSLPQRASSEATRPNDDHPTGLVPQPTGLAVSTAPPAALQSGWQQTWQRTRSDVAEQVMGVTTFEFSAGQRTAWTHVPIWPAMPATPSVTLAQPQGEPAGLAKATQIEPYGVRFELRLSRAADHACLVSVQFRLEAPQRTAAS